MNLERSSEIFIRFICRCFTCVCDRCPLNFVKVVVFGKHQFSVTIKILSRMFVINRKCHLSLKDLVFSSSAECRDITFEYQPRLLHICLLVKSGLSDTGDYSFSWRWKSCAFYEETQNLHCVNSWKRTCYFFKRLKIIVLTCSTSKAVWQIRFEPLQVYFWLVSEFNEQMTLNIEPAQKGQRFSIFPLSISRPLQQKSWLHNTKTALAVYWCVCLFTGL